MNSSSWNEDNSSKSGYPNSLDYNMIIHSKNLFDDKTPKKNRTIKKSNLQNNKYKKHDFEYLLKYVHKYFISFYKSEEDDYNIKMIEDILDNEETHLVAEFKDFLIMGDINEFLQKYYKITDSKKYLPKICDYYLKSSLIFPNYVSIQESKYIYKNIRKKQKLIDHQQEQDNIKEKNKNKKKDNESESIDDFFSSKTLNSILQQTNTSIVKLIFGMENDNKNNKNKKNKDIDNNDINEDETTNKIIENLNEIEKKIEENKNKKKLMKDNIKEYNNKNNKNDNSFNKFVQNSNSCNKNKKHIYLKQGNKNMNLLKINNSNASSNKSSRIYKSHNNKKRVINTYLSKKQITNENNSNNYAKSDASSTGRDSDYIQKKYLNYFFINNHKNNKRKLLIENSLNQNKSIVNNNINTLIPSKECITKFFVNNNYSRSVLKYNSFNFITKNIEKRNNSIFPFSPSLNTIQVNPFKKKYGYNLNININNSNSTKSVNKIINSNSSEQINNDEKEKIKKNKGKNKNSIKNSNNINNLYKHHNNTISLTINIMNCKDKNKNTQKCNTDRNAENKSQTKNKDNKYYNGLRTIGNNKINKNVIENILYLNKNKKVINKNNNNYKLNKNINTQINQIKIKNLNFQKINSLTNINKSNTANKKRKNIFPNQNSRENIFSNRIFPVSPLSIKLDSNKTPSIKKTLNLKPKKNNKNNIYKNVNTNNNIPTKSKNYFIDAILNSPKNKQQIINSGIKSQLILDELNKKKSIIFPFKKEINIINININGYNNTERGSQTSRESNSRNKKRLKEYKGKNKAEINFYNQEMKVKFKNKKEKNNLMSRNKNNNPVIIKGIYDSIGKNQIFKNQQNSGFYTYRK